MVRNGVEVIGEEVGQEAGDRNRASLMGLGRADDQPTVNFGGGRQHVKVWSDRLPHTLTDVFGLTHNQFTRPADVGLILRDDLDATGDFARDELAAMHFMDYYALTAPSRSPRTTTKPGQTMRPSPDTSSVPAAPSTCAHHDKSRIAATVARSPPRRKVVGLEPGPCRNHRRSRSQRRWSQITYFLNYSADEVGFPSPVTGRSLLDQAMVERGTEIRVGRWDLAIVES